ncbi:hypothetical protein FE535_19910 [Clostridioides difficile]|jgi:hypothetical protein|nr:hypothetical protein [Clostridioides difficile]
MKIVSITLGLLLFASLSARAAGDDDAPKKRAVQGCDIEAVKPNSKTYRLHVYYDNGEMDSETFSEEGEAQHAWNLSECPGSPR